MLEADSVQVNQMISMGFSCQDSIVALKLSNNNINYARLLMTQLMKNRQQHLSLRTEDVEKECSVPVSRAMCIICYEDSIDPKEEFIDCSGCGNHFHADCIAINRKSSEDHVNRRLYLTEQYSKWVCWECSSRGITFTETLSSTDEVQKEENFHDDDDDDVVIDEEMFGFNVVDDELEIEPDTTTTTTEVFNFSPCFFSPSFAILFFCPALIL